METRSAQLRVKIKNLADEAGTIRHEERRALRDPRDFCLYGDLRDHRRGVVRRAARTALLAYALLRDVSYERCEQNAAADPDWAEVRKTAERFGACRRPEEAEEAWRTRREAQRQAFDAWLVAAKGTRLKGRGCPQLLGLRAPVLDATRPPPPSP